ncbi:MAG: hypothetical protein Q8M57_14365 [Nitrosomonas sp.]|uniref:hypothetical protein n=1 Tax=Nitrosomonas sp. TaxID=42353 RepID=UPI0027338978|nr:hypothetical protein [Nitrosomonas sp.]MDP3282202.1 hypothetical protein [Nitrosomonas sp.]
MKMRMNITIWLAVLLVMVSFNTHAAEVPAPAPVPTVEDPGAGKGIVQGETGKNEGTGKKDQSKEWVVADPRLIYAVISVIFLGSLISVALIRSALSDSKWSLADALSEEAKVSSLEADGNGGFKPRSDAAGNPVMITELRASSSRMIALVGMMVILLMFLGFGIFAVYSFSKTGVMPDTENITNFLIAGLTLFAPYLVNQFAAIFEKLAPKKS